MHAQFYQNAFSRNKQLIDIRMNFKTLSDADFFLINPSFNVNFNK